MVFISAVAKSWRERWVDGQTDGHTGGWTDGWMEYYTTLIDLTKKNEIH